MKTAKELLQTSFVIDTHLDLLLEVDVQHAKGRSNVIVEDYLEDFRAGGVDAVVSSLYVRAEDLPELGLKKLVDQVSALYRELDTCDGAFVLATCVDDLLEARRKGQLAIMLAFEGIEPLNGHIEHLRLFYQLGVRILGPCWSRSGWACDGSRFFDHEYEGYGLTEEGRKLIQYARELGMLIDVSHTNEKTFWDIVNSSTGPVIATHSNTRRYSDTPRNLSDEQIRAIGKLGGVIGVNGASLVANIVDAKAATVELLADHMLHEIGLTSTGIACIGLDQCDRLSGNLSLPADNIFDIIPTYAKLEELVQALLDRGLDEEAVTAILGGNALRVFKEVIG